jgi:hypothetical protein
VLLVLLVAMALHHPPAVAQPATSTASASQDTAAHAAPPALFNAGVSTTYLLPQGMIGLWSVQAHLEASPRADLFPPIIKDIWQLQQTQREVTLINPNTGGRATVEVEAVNGQQARFYHVVTSGRQTFIERPDIEVVGNTLKGHTTIERLVSSPQGRSQRYWARYRLAAQRLHPHQGPVVRSHTRQAPPSAPTIEIAPLQPLGTPLPWAP